MRFARWRHGSHSCFGLVRDDDSLFALPDDNGRDAAFWLTPNGIAAARDMAMKAPASTEALKDVQLLPPIARPGKILCVGVNYPDRNAEYKDGSGAPPYPSLFVRFPSSFVGHGEPLLRPTISEQFDYEGEIVIVIGTAGRRISQARAANHIAGLTLMNEGSVRDWLRHGKFNVTQGKNFDRSGSIGPWITTLDQAAALDALELTTHVNGDERQRGNTGTLAFPFARIIEYISTFTTLEPGDMIATGTPTGAGARFTPPKWLKAGDIVTVASPSLGTLRNVVADEIL
jgi:2-keto-4-pentenoate hydratase/2-oxohepta-3-ene-1,7-dioic acid hydratase in catechol pathway